MFCNIPPYDPKDKYDYEWFCFWEITSVDNDIIHAKEIGFGKTYIPSEHIGLYEKYGYQYLKDIVNYGGGTDRLYVKEIK